MKSPLKGLRVLDLSRLLPGPLATMHLADMGAEVIKLESPSKPDYLRLLEPYLDGQNVGFNVLNRGKRSVFVAYQTEPGAKLVRELAAGCDVLVESFRPGYLSRFRLDFESLRELKPDLIYCSISAYGQNSSRAGHDLNSLALSGLSHLLANRGEPRVPLTQLTDFTCGLSASQAILAALYARDRGGGGAHLDIAMTDAAYHFSLLESASTQAGVESYDSGLLNGDKPYYRYYRCSDDRYLAVGAVEEKFRFGLLEALRVDDLDQAESVFLKKPLQHWVALLDPLDLCVEPVLTPGEVVESGWMKERYAGLRIPPGIQDATFGSEDGACALPGQHTREVLGLSDQMFDELSASGVVLG